MIIDTWFSKIGDENNCYIIAEIGSNHNGNFDLACELIEKAADAGVNAVKFQTFKASNHYSTKTPRISLYNQNVYELIESLEINRAWHSDLAKLCKSKKIDFLDSPCDIDAVILAESIDMPLMKLASFDMIDIRLLDAISKTGKGLIFSTGMSNMAEIEMAVNICRKNNNDKIVVLQCTSIYPAPIHLSNLRAMDTIKKSFNVITGYSDHTLGDHIACAAVAIGAKVIEKHYTLNRDFEGPDHNFAIQPEELKQMINKIRDIEYSLGDGIKNGPRLEEMESYTIARRSLIANRDIEEGEIIQEDDIVVKRPGLGVHPSMIQYVVGRIAKKKIMNDEPITWDLI